MAKILIVDDSGFSRRTMRAILEGSGHEVEEAGSGMAALERYMLFRPDVVMLDLTMPDMTGVEVLAKLKQMDPKARVVIASADVQTSTQDEVMQLGAAGFIMKPFTSDRVIAEVSSHLRKDDPCN